MAPRLRRGLPLVLLLHLAARHQPMLLLLASINVSSRYHSAGSWSQDHPLRGSTSTARGLWAVLLALVLGANVGPRTTLPLPGPVLCYTVRWQWLLLLLQLAALLLLLVLLVVELLGGGLASPVLTRARGAAPGMRRLSRAGRSSSSRQW